MPPKKTIKTRRVSRRGDVTADAATTSTVSPTKHLELAAFPHILSLILSYASAPTLFRLLRCSKALHRAAASLLYRTLYLRPHQLTEMIESGWAPSKQGTTSSKLGSSFSLTLRACLQHVQTLHLLEYHPSNPCPDIPRGVFSNNQNVVLHIAAAKYIRMVLPTYFHTLGGSHLYIRLSADGMQQLTDHATTCTVDRLPRSFTSMTLLVPSACRLSQAPRFDFMYDSKVHTCDTTVVLLPWRQGEQDAETKLQQTMLARWSVAFQPFRLNELPYKSTMVGAEYAALSVDENELLGQPNPVRRPWSFTPVHDWLTALAPGTIFTVHEHAKFIVADLRLHQRLSLDELSRIEQNLDKHCAEGTVHPNTVAIRQRIVRASQVAAAADAAVSTLSRRL